MTRTHLLAPLASLAAMLSAPAWAADCTTQVSPLVFGQYRAIDGTTADITATITVSCVAVAPEALSYDLRIAPSATGATRVMHGTTGDLRYELYTSLNGRQRWGDGTGATGVVSGSMNLAAGERHSETHTVNGRILADRRARAGVYTDALAVYLVLRP